MLSKENPHFSIKDTCFNMEQYKVGSSRQVFFTEFKVLNSFTLENSYFKKMIPQEVDGLLQVQITDKDLDLVPILDPESIKKLTHSVEVV